MISNKKASIVSSENQLSLSSFELFSDNSSVKFCLNASTQYFDIKNFEFYADVDSFRKFLSGIEKVYENKMNSVELRQSFEDSTLKIETDDLGHIRIICEVYYYGSYKEICKTNFEVDQSFLQDFIKELKVVYLELGF